MLVLSPRTKCAQLGVVGPAARAAGVALDARVDSPRLSYRDFSPAVPSPATGDVAGRMDVRAMELEVTLGLLDELLAEGVEPAGHCRGCRPNPWVWRASRVRAEKRSASWKPPTTASRVFTSAPASYANWPALARAAAGEILPDFPLINKSFELCYSCCDR